MALTKTQVAMLEATGTPDNTTFLRGDGAWGVPAGTSSGGFTAMQVFKYFSGTAAISGTTLTVSAAPIGGLSVGSIISGTGVSAGTTITAFGTGSGGVGTYTISISQTVASRAMTSSSATFTVPAGKTAAKVTLISGGQGGQGGNGAFGGCAPAYYGGGGGSSGGAAVKFISGLTPLSTVSVTLGAGGAGGGCGSAIGATGGTSSFGAYVSATSGTGVSGDINFAAITGQAGDGGDSRYVGSYVGLGGCSILANYGRGGDGGTYGVNGTNGGVGVVIVEY